MGQQHQFPSAATANRVRNHIQDLTPSVFGGTLAVFWGGNQRLQAAPLGIGEIAVVRSAAFHLDSVMEKGVSNAPLGAHRHERSSALMGTKRQKEFTGAP